MRVEGEECEEEENHGKRNEKMGVITYLRGLGVFFSPWHFLHIWRCIRQSVAQTLSDSGEVSACIARSFVNGMCILLFLLGHECQ